MQHNSLNKALYAANIGLMFSRCPDRCKFCALTNLLVIGFAQTWVFQHHVVNEQKKKHTAVCWRSERHYLFPPINDTSSYVIIIIIIVIIMSILANQIIQCVAFSCTMMPFATEPRFEKKMLSVSIIHVPKVTTWPVCNYVSILNWSLYETSSHLLQLCRQVRLLGQLFECLLQAGCISMFVQGYSSKMNDSSSLRHKSELSIWWKLSSSLDHLWPSPVRLHSGLLCVLVF